MIRLSFTEEDIEKLRYEKSHHVHPRVRQKVEVIYLKAMGLPHNELCRLCQIAPTTLRRYLTDYIKHGIEGLKVFCVQQPHSKLHGHKTSIEDEFRKLPPATVGEAMVRIEELTGIKLCYTQIREFLLRIGMKPRVVGSIPAKADPAEQEEFSKKNSNRF